VPCDRFARASFLSGFTARLGILHH
jgi:hypothetical protein